MTKITDTEIESERQLLIADLAQEREQDVAELIASVAPGTFACHEAMHMTSVVMDNIDQHIADHPAIAANPEWFRLATRASETLFRLYEEIASLHLALAGDGDGGTRPENLNSSNDG